MPTYRVLSFDGGGVRGLMTTMLLERLCQQPGLEHAFDGIDLIAGNSSGALVALAMAHGLGHPTMRETLGHIQLAFENAPKVFGPPRWPNVLWIPWLFLTKYRNEARAEAVRQLLSEKRLRDLNTHVLITAFDLENVTSGPGRRTTRLWKPKIFHNFIGPNSDRELFAWQAALYSTAAITYFPSVDGYVDGGVYGNNPSMCALAQVFDARYPPKPKPRLEDVLLFSVGAGQNLESVPRQRVRWGLAEWAWKGKFVNLATDATVGVADYECRQLLTDSNYRRLNPDFGGHPAIALDDFDALEDIKQRLESPEVEEQIKECAEWLREHWMAGRTTGPILPEPTSRHVGTATELICVMPIKPGFLPVLETISYATRLRAVFKVLQILRTVSREQRTLKPVLDIVEAARTVLSFSWAILLEKNLLLNVTFDRPWEPYIRVVWKDLGPLLDLFLCNCEGFVPSSEGFDQFAEFVRRHQVEASFFYPASSYTVDDEAYLVQLEKLQRRGDANIDLESVKLISEGPTERSEQDRDANHDEAGRQWLAVLDVLYGLRNLYPPDSVDNNYLRRAAKALLDGSRPKIKMPRSAALDWLEFEDSEVGAGFDERRKLDPASVQGGIQRPYKLITEGCLILAGVDKAATARAFVGGMADWVTRGDEDPVRGHPNSGAVSTRGKIYRNVAFTANGLKQLGVNESVRASFPKEFREGMDARAGLLGDIRQNHPERWSLPLAFGSRIPIRMSTVDMVITLNMVDPEGGPDALKPEIQQLCEQLVENGFTVLSVEHLRRMRPKSDDNSGRKPLSRDHFGFLDGISQPNASNDPNPEKRDDVELGEIFVGFQNQRGDPAFPEENTDPLAWGRGSLIDCGSFLVVRKLRQYVGALNNVIETEEKAGVGREELLAKMVGRYPNGKPLTDKPHKGLNDFDFKGDDGAICPYHSHIRRGNPRLEKQALQVPRMARRSLAYGPDFRRDAGDDREDRGVMFMAYNASIAEQFEILQRWMSGGNTPAGNGNTGVFSGQPDPLLGLPDVDGTRVYCFVDSGGQARRVDLGEQPFVTLQWGLYLFAPSINALTLLAREPETDYIMGLAGTSLGEQVIRNLKSGDDWAAAIEDLTSNSAGITSAVLAAIRIEHQGVLRTPYGVIVASEKLAMQVLASDPTFSVSEYQKRFAASVGESYLGMDRGREYERLSTPLNKTLTLINRNQAFADAHVMTTQVIAEAIEQAAAPTKRLLSDSLEDRWVPLPLGPVADCVLARLAQKWFDIPDGELIGVGGPPENDEDVRCPASFLAPSRYVFSSPNPRDAVSALGQSNGQRLLERARQFVKARTSTADGFRAPISRALFQAIDVMDLGEDEKQDLLARTLLGLVFGFVPTVYGNALAVLGTWINDESLWRVQQRFCSAAGGPYEKAESIVWPAAKRAMLARPVPSLLYRTVTEATTLGGVGGVGAVELRPGDRVVIAMSAVTQEIQQGKRLDVMPIFGGDRKADGHPTHACPGYDIATGVLLGILTAVVEKKPSAPAPALVTIRVPRPQLDQAHSRR